MMQFFNKCRKILSSKLILAPLLAMTLSSCVTAALTVATIATIDIFHDRRSVGEYIDDSAIEIKANNYLLADYDLRQKVHIKPTSWNGILLLTGEVSDESTKQSIVTFMTDIQGVRQIVDETTIKDKTRLFRRTNDTWITTKTKSLLLRKMGMDGNRVKVVTVRGNVYLMGIVTQSEATRASELARTVRGVSRVIKVFEYKT